MSVRSVMAEIKLGIEELLMMQTATHRANIDVIELYATELQHRLVAVVWLHDGAENTLQGLLAIDDLHVCTPTPNPDGICAY